MKLPFILMNPDGRHVNLSEKQISSCDSGEVLHQFVVSVVVVRDSRMGIPPPRPGRLRSYSSPPSHDLFTIFDVFFTQQFFS
jgi:hypothetical protein